MRTTSLKSRVTSLERRIARQRTTEFRSAEDVLADMRVAGMPQEVARARMILILAPYARDPHVTDELRTSCRDHILAIDHAMSMMAKARASVESLRDKPLFNPDDPKSGIYQRDMDAALRIAEELRAAL